MEPLSPEIQKKIEEIVRSYPDKWGHGVCAFTMITKDTGKTVGRGQDTGDVCHAALTAAKENVVVINAHRPTWKKTSAEYLKWATKEAPFTSGVLNKDDEDTLFNHAGILDVSVIGKGGALWVCKAVRHFVEDTHKIAFWEKLREQGLDGFQSFIGSDILNSNGGPMNTNTHVSLFCYSSPDKLRKWYDEIRTTEKIESTAANRGGYDYGGGAVIKNWGSLKGKTIKKKDGWGGFIEVPQPCDAKEYAACLKEIFEGDPKNVK